MFARIQDKSLCLSDKKEYIAVDFVKFVCAFFVMMIHIQILDEPYEKVNFWLVNVPCRLAVPFFFLTAGFFVAGKVQEQAQIKKYIGRIMRLYIIYTIIYGEYIITPYQEKMGWNTLLKIGKDFFFYGSYLHLWYLIALVWAVGMLYVFFVKCGWTERIVAYWAIVLYGIGVCGNAYSNLFLEVPVMREIFAFFGTTRNGIFFGFPYIVLGYFLFKYGNRIALRNIYWIYFIFCFMFMNVEEYIAKMLTNHEGQSMLFTTPLVVVSLFLAVASVRVPQKWSGIGRFVRNLSFLIYVWHIYVHLKFGPELSGYTMIMTGLPYFIMIAKRIIIISAGIVLLSKIKIFSWLKYLY